nr:uncharacterized protein LOC109192376 [Ipomoea trifida]
MVQVNDLVKLDKQVQAGMVLNPEYFMIGATDKEEARKILRALKECNLLRFCTYSYYGINEVDIAEFYLHASNFEGEIIRSKVGGIEVELFEQDIRECFNFP